MKPILVAMHFSHCTYYSVIVQFVPVKQYNVCSLLDSEAANAPGDHALPSVALHDVKDHLEG